MVLLTTVGLVETIEDWKLTCGSDERGRGEGSHGDTSFLSFPEIGEGATDDGDGGRESDAIDGSTDQKGRNVLRECARDDKHHGDKQR